MAKWSEENSYRLAAMASEGATASEIAAALGITRGAVLGRAHRLDISLAHEKSVLEEESPIWADPGPAWAKASAEHLRDLNKERRRGGLGWASYRIGSEPSAMSFRPVYPGSLFGSAAAMCAEVG